jgi:hypothetical protein
VTAKLRLIDGRSTEFVTVPAYQVDEASMELAVALDERLAHAAEVRHYARLAMHALSTGAIAMAGTWLTELDRLNEREANRARAAQAQVRPCPDGIREIGHGKAA